MGGAIRRPPDWNALTEGTAVNVKGMVGAVALLALMSISPSIWAAPGTTGGGSLLLGKAVPNASLKDKRGGHATTVNTNQLNAKLYDNQAIANITGTNTISTSAFAGMSGYATVVQNSGNNVIIQNATILNVKMQ